MQMHAPTPALFSMHYLEADTCPRGKQAAFGDVPDPALRLTAYWADCEAHLAGDLPAARAVWEAVLRTAAGRCGRAQSPFKSPFKIPLALSLRDLHAPSPTRLLTCSSWEPPKRNPV